MPDEKNPKPKTELTFEKGLERLEKIVKELEQGDLPLERALELFEEGMKLSGNCRRQLEEAENKRLFPVPSIDVILIASASASVPPALDRA